MIFRLLEDQFAERARAATSADRRYMELALTLGRRGLGRTAPNPAVGAVIVKDGIIIGRGWTQDGGRPHAEVVALSQAGTAARGATLYVTLEPCSHVGRSPPCADAVIAAGIARVVSAIEDCNPEVAGQGHARLRAAGITVEVGLCRDEGARAHRGHLLRMSGGRPEVVLKLAISSDGRIAGAGRQPVAITGEAARGRVHLLRAQCDAVLVGIGTVLADDPELTCRLSGMRAQSPIRVVLDSAARTPPQSRLAANAREVPLWIACSDTAEAPAIALLEARGAEIIRLRGESDLGDMLAVLAQRGVTRLMVEGGAEIAASFIRAGCVDVVWLFQGPRAIGEGGLHALADISLSAITASGDFVASHREVLDGDTLTIYERASCSQAS
jgi:diaminohydroxyphosphoribosylaminopyrimidine deaminase/5-amino-6-(5-phosphoribosylamino)uracil reductase